MRKNVWSQTMFVINIYYEKASTIKGLRYSQNKVYCIRNAL